MTRRDATTVKRVKRTVPVTRGDVVEVKMGIRAEKYVSIALYSFIYLGWALLVLYPSPSLLVQSLYRLHNPPLDRVLVADFAAELLDYPPDSIKERVYSQLPYSYDWHTYSMPWYFPTLEEALEQGRGDCKARYLFFASILEELEIPYQKNVSLHHIWVGYEGKQDNLLENSAEAFVSYDDQGRAKFSLPYTNLRNLSTTLHHSFWEIMPQSKKLSLILGFPAAFILSKPVSANPKSRQGKSRKSGAAL